MKRIQYPYIWLFCGFAALGACLYGYDGVYFNGVSTLGSTIAPFPPPFSRLGDDACADREQMSSFDISVRRMTKGNMRSPLELSRS